MVQTTNDLVDELYRYFERWVIGYGYSLEGEAPINIQIDNTGFTLDKQVVVRNPDLIKVEEHLKAFYRKFKGLLTKKKIIVRLEQNDFDVELTE